ncbi:amino acid ABC transporter membrane protein 2, PAAT family [Nocardioides exalbidus]|uniref:Amino acid ABC transporter membrane protein 2, PAAT family n=1 Tax=Nocardioides exalbidus TaxID=402596 RepID=A0A1H4KWW3_9ACTN|nr:amino acid ABC transporter permease [Nocardioides exalbidus]SEB62585.1 amino acid ABC transporter membrane protein 2, PAAT family [Nocardioides exalbidus]
MAAGVLFDAPGPATRARHRAYGIATVVALVVLLGWVLWRFSETGQFEYAKWEPFVTPRYIQAILVDGLLVTLQMAASAIVGAIVFGLIFGIGKLSDHAWVRWPCWLVVEFFRAVPVILLIVFVFYSVVSGMDELSRRTYWAVVIALTLYNGAVLAEVFRAGINAVPKGQAEAAYALGMRKYQVMSLILLPQAVKIMIPAIISQMIVALKDTSLGYVVAGLGLTRVAKAIYPQFANHVPTIIVIAAIYIVVNLLLTWLATWVQKKLVGERKILEVGMVGEDKVGASAPFYKGDTGGGPV